MSLWDLMTAKQCCLSGLLLSALPVPNDFVQSLYQEIHHASDLVSNAVLCCNYMHWPHGVTAVCERAE